MILVVQQITVRWTKRSRSGSGAGARSALPDALPVPAFAPPSADASIVLHRAEFAEWNGFSRAGEQVEVEPLAAGAERVFGCVRVRLVDGAAEVTYAYDLSCGAPRRSGYPRKVMTLGAGEWGRAAYNGRTSGAIDSGDWVYHRTLVNVTCSDRLPADPFASPPAREFSDMADLW